MPYGDGYLALDVPAQNLRDVIYPRQLAEESRSESEIIRLAMHQPIASPRLREIAHKGQRVAIVTSDFTRPCPSGLLIPFILEELYAAG
jgi:nickel-dependent lactate racemase